jgi:hypothetical protein
MKFFITLLALTATCISCDIVYTKEENAPSPQLSSKEMIYPKEYTLTDEQVSQFLLPQNAKPYADGSSIFLIINDAKFELYLTQPVKEALEKNDTTIKSGIVAIVQDLSKTYLSRMYNEEREKGNSSKIKGVIFNFYEGQLSCDFLYHLPTRYYQVHLSDGSVLMPQSN